MFFGKKTGKKDAIGEITRVESFSLRISGMRGTREYEITADGEETTIAEYRYVYRTGEEEKRPERARKMQTSEVLALLNASGVENWNGFDGPHPKHVSDGEMFTLNAVVNDGQKLHASGSENFPKGYREFVRGLEKLLF